MSREDGFAVADVSTDLLDDPKVRALWRALGEPGRMGHALTLYTATVLASWRNGCRVTVDEAAPIWLTPDDELVAALQSVRLLDKARKLPARSWNGWFGPAYERREARRRSGALGGLRQRGKRSDSDARAMLQRRYSEATPDRSDRTGPFLPSDRTVSSRARAREAPSNGDLATTMAAMGLTVPK